MNCAKEYKKKLVEKICALKNVDRSTYFTKKELELIDKVFNLVLQEIELDTDCQ